MITMNQEVNEADMMPVAMEIKILLLRAIFISGKRSQRN